ncbi:hypothetical protein Tco_1549457 [Tanacetum coccineum]
MVGSLSVTGRGLCAICKETSYLCMEPKTIDGVATMIIEQVENRKDTPQYGRKNGASPEALSILGRYKLWRAVSCEKSIYLTALNPGKVLAKFVKSLLVKNTKKCSKKGDCWGSGRRRCFHAAQEDSMLPSTIVDIDRGGVDIILSATDGQLARAMQIGDSVKTVRAGPPLLLLRRRFPVILRSGEDRSGFWFSMRKSAVFVFHAVVVYKRCFMRVLHQRGKSAYGLSRLRPIALERRLSFPRSSWPFGFGDTPCMVKKHIEGVIDIRTHFQSISLALGAARVFSTFWSILVEILLCSMIDLGTPVMRFGCLQRYSRFLARLSLSFSDVRNAATYQQ